MYFYFFHRRAKVPCLYIFKCHAFSCYHVNKTSALVSRCKIYPRSHLPILSSARRHIGNVQHTVYATNLTIYELRLPSPRLQIVLLLFGQYFF